MAVRHPRPPGHPIRAVVRLTGLSLDTLRSWERRYEAVVPGRTRRGRLYSDADVGRLRQLGALVKRGHPIGTIASLSDDELAGLLRADDAQVVEATAPPHAADLAPLARALDRYDLADLEARLTRFALVIPPADLIFAVVVPLLQEIGRRWETGRLRPAQEHLASAIVRSVLGGLLRATGRPDASPTVVFATPSGERHELGLLCAAVLAASAGFGVLYLGADLPAEEIGHAAATSGARVVVVSLTTPGGASRRELRALAAKAPGVELWAGGPEAGSLLTLVGDGGRYIESLPALVPMLSRHAR